MFRTMASTKADTAGCSTSSDSLVDTSHCRLIREMLTC